MGRQQVVVLRGLGLVGLVHRDRDDKLLTHKEINTLVKGIICRIRREG